MYVIMVSGKDFQGKMKITKNQIRRILKETMYNLWANYSPESIKAAEAALNILDHDPNVRGAEVENEIHNYLENTLGMSSSSDEIFAIGDEAMEAAEVMLGLPKDTL